jgi:hypothetical protein
MAAMKGENLAYPFALQRANDHFSAVDLRHGRNLRSVPARAMKSRVFQDARTVAKVILGRLHPGRQTRPANRGSVTDGRSGCAPVLPLAPPDPG